MKFIFYSLFICNQKKIDFLNFLSFNFFQEDEAKALKERLDKELNMLKDYQRRQKNCLEDNCERERQKLYDRISIRKDVLDGKVEIYT